MMKAKVLVPNKFWIVENGKEKVATLSKEKKGYRLLSNGHRFEALDLTEIKQRFGITIEDDNNKQNNLKDSNYEIYGFPIPGKAYDPLWNVKKKLPIYSKSSKSKSLYCAGYYIIKFRKGWVKSFCPKLITLERYEFKGPFKTEIEMKTILKIVNKENNAEA